MVINFRGKQKLVTDYRHSRRRAVMKMPSWVKGTFCLLHTSLIAKQTRWGLIPLGGRRPISGQVGRREALIWVKRRRCGQQPGTAAPGASWHWCQAKVEPHPGRQLIHPNCTPFIKHRSFPESISSRLVRIRSLILACPTIIVASWKAALLIYGAYCFCWRRGRLCLGPQMVTLALKCHRNAHFLCLCCTWIYTLSLLCHLVLWNSNSGGHIMLFGVCLSTLLNWDRRDKDFLAIRPIPLLPKCIVICESRQGCIQPELC